MVFLYLELFHAAKLSIYFYNPYLSSVHPNFYFLRFGVEFQCKIAPVYWPFMCTTYLISSSQLNWILFYRSRTFNNKYMYLFFSCKISFYVCIAMAIIKIWCIFLLKYFSFFSSLLYLVSSSTFRLPLSRIRMYQNICRKSHHLYK